MDEKTQKIEHIIRLNQSVMDFSLTSKASRQENPWFTNLLTMQQFKTMLLVTLSQPEGTTVGSLARDIGVGLPTMSGIVDRLYEQKLLTRHEDTTDRRITRIVTTEEGLRLMEKLRYEGFAHWRLWLNRLDEPSLQIVERAFELISEAAHADTSHVPTHNL